jgi:hypothetical protein
MGSRLNILYLSSPANDGGVVASFKAWAAIIGARTRPRSKANDVLPSSPGTGQPRPRRRSQASSMAMRTSPPRSKSMAGVATSSSPFRSLFHGDEDIAAPNPVPSGAMSGSGSGSGSNRMLHTVSNPMAIPIPIPTRAAWAAARAPRHSSNGTIRGRHPSSHAELLKLTAISLRNHVRCAVSHLP